MFSKPRSNLHEREDRSVLSPQTPDHRQKWEPPLPPPTRKVSPPSPSCWCRWQVAGESCCRSRTLPCHFFFTWLSTPRLPFAPALQAATWDAKKKRKIRKGEKKEVPSPGGNPQSQGWGKPCRTPGSFPSTLPPRPHPTNPRKFLLPSVLSLCLLLACS